CGLGERGCHHRRIRPRDPRERWRPLGGDRRHPGDLRLDPRPHHRRARLDLPRPHDRAGGGGGAAEDAERDRAQHPAGRHDFVLAVGTIPSFAAYAGGSIAVLVLVALFVTLIPTTIGALLSAIGIAGMDRLVRFNVLAMSGRAVEAAGDVDTLLL